MSDVVFKETAVYTNYTAAMVGAFEMFKQGWELDPAQPPNQLGFAYEAFYIRKGEPPKSRAEILEAARAAKAAKKGSE